MKNFIKVSIFVILCMVSHHTASFAQRPWTKSVNIMSPIHTYPQWYTHVFMPCVLYNPDSSRYEMWFGASGASTRPYSIGFAYSSDGIHWAKHPTAVLVPDPGTWDESTVEGPSVIRENGQYKMWYHGNSLTDTIIGIGYATSPDGIA